MRTRVANRWVLWLLPLFVLRSLVPVGFMLDANADLVLCAAAGPVFTQVATDTSHAGHEHHAHHAEQSPDTSKQHQHSSAHQSSLCVFAAAGHASAPTAHLATSFDAPTPSAPNFFVTDPELNSLPVLIDRIRGPPNA